MWNKRISLRLDTSFAFGDGVQALCGIISWLADHRLCDKWLVPPNRLLMPADVRRASATSFIEAALPDDLVRAPHHVRYVRLWQACPELWCEALGREDLTRLVGALRIHVLECDSLLSTLRFTNQRGTGGGTSTRAPTRRIEIELVDEAAIEQTREVWLALSWRRLRAMLAERATITRAKTLPPPSPEQLARIEAILKRALDVLAKPPASKLGDAEAVPAAGIVAALSTPGINLADVREILGRRALSRRRWKRLVVDELAGVAMPDDTPERRRAAARTLATVLRIFPPDKVNDPLTRPTGSLKAPLPEKVPSDDLVVATTRILWHPLAQASVAKILWERARKPEATRLRASVRDIVRGLRRRYRQTLHSHYQRVALPLRMLSAELEPTGPAAPEETVEHIGDAFECVRREIKSLRMSNRPSEEVELYRWFEPHLSALPEEFRTELQARAAEFELMTAAVLLSLRRSLQTPKRAPGKAEEAETAREIGEIVGVLDRLASRAEVPEWIQAIARWLAVPAEQANAAALATFWSAFPTSATDSDPELRLKSVELLRWLGDAGDTSSDEVRGELERVVEATRRRRTDRHGRRFQSRCGDAFSCLLLAQSEMAWRTQKPDWTPFASDWRKENRTHRIEGTEHALLKEALSGLERPQRKYALLLTRLVLAFDLRLAIGRGPDMTFLAPVLKSLEDHGGPETFRRIERLMERTAHRALLAQELASQRRRSAAPRNDDLSAEVDRLLSLLDRSGLAH